MKNETTYEKLASGASMIPGIPSTTKIVTIPIGDGKIKKTVQNFIKLIFKSKNV